MVRFFVSILLLFGLAPVRADDLPHIYKPNCPRSRAGTIIGSIRPRGLAYTLFLRHRESGRTVVHNVGLSTRDCDFTIGRLEPGIYDLIITPFEKKNELPRSKKYPILAGQGIPDSYSGLEMDKNDRTLVKELAIKILPALYKEAYIKQNPDHIRKSAHATPQFTDQVLDLPDTGSMQKLGVLPRLGFMKDKKTTAPLDYGSTRTLVTIGGGPAKAFAITHCQERFTFPSYVRTYLDRGKTKQERVAKPQSMDYEYDEMFLFTKAGGQWRVDLRRPINASELIYRAKDFPERDIDFRHVYYYTQGPLVGITVKPRKTRDLGTLTVPGIQSGASGVK